MRYPVSIRPFTLADLDRVLAIEKLSFGRDAWPKRMFLDYFRSQPELFLIARVGRRIAGYSITSFDLRRAELASLAVDPKDRGKRIAQALLHFSLAELHKRRFKTWWLMVEITNASAIRLYEKFGFTRTRVSKNYYASGRNAWRMRLELPAGESGPKQ